ncbi:MAG: CehA/McbA family metallohydrolase [Vicinamibacterales bacterium]
MLTCILLALALQGSLEGREIVLDGTITAADRYKWLEREFEVPAGTARIDIQTGFTEAAQGTALEFGLYDPIRFRGASRFSKTSFFVSRTAATPSYYPGDLPAGRWRLLMGVPTIRDGVTSQYHIVIRLTSEGPSQPSPTALATNIAASGPRWYQGELHTHTLHSDGYGCADGRGGAGPCGVQQVVDAASRRGLDFVAVTDHNTTSHHQELVDLQPRYERMLLLRGQEVTTFYGHANVYGTSEVVDFRIGHPGVTASTVFSQAHQLGGLVSVNHPARETGEKCTGCGWNAPETDWSQVDAMEVVNQFIVSGPTAGEPFWQARLNEGRRLTGIGGGDDHGASTRAGSAVGTPTNAIYAESLSEAALLAGIKAGHVYIKTRGPEGPDVRLTAPGMKPAGSPLRYDGAMMGDVVTLDAATKSVQFQVVVISGSGQTVEVIRNGKIVESASTRPLPNNHVTLDLPVEVSRGDNVRVTIRDGAGVTVFTNPIYVR